MPLLIFPYKLTSLGSGEPINIEVEKHDLVPEILTITHDHRNPFKVDFDDPAWKQYITSLKPLGLSILLNTCNLATEEKYTNFFNYLICESIRLENQIFNTKENGILFLKMITPLFWSWVVARVNIQLH